MDRESVRVFVARRSRGCRSPRASIAMRSLSLTRSSCAPRTVIDTPGCIAASAASPGISSMTPGTSSGVISKDCRVRDSGPSMRPWVPRRICRGTPAFRREIDDLDLARRPAAERRAPPIRDGFSPTPSMTRSESGVPAARTSQNNADEMSPGTSAIDGAAGAGRRRRRPHAVPSHANAERLEGALRMIPCRRPVR